MKIKLIILIFSALIFYSCAPTQVNSPALVLKIQEREERIINEQLQKKLDPIEGIWQSNYGRIQQTEAFYKRGENFIWEILQNGSGGQVKKTSEYNYEGKCSMPDLIGSVEGKLVILSRDDNTLDVKCFRKNFVSQTEKTSKAISDIFSAGCLLCPENEAKARDYEVKGVFKRLWPENLAEHNSKF